MTWIRGFAGGFGEKMEAMGVSRGVATSVRLESFIAATPSSSSSSWCVPALVSYAGLKRSAGFSSSRLVRELRVAPAASRGGLKGLRVEAAAANGAPQSFDYDVVIIGAGVGGHGAALHAVERVMSSHCGTLFSCMELVLCFALRFNL